MAGLTGSQNEQYFVRLYLLMVESTKVLNAKFDSFIPPADIRTNVRHKELTALKFSQHEIKSIMGNNMDLSECDISILASLLRNFCYKPQKKDPLWSDTDNTNIMPYQQCDISQIVRIRNLRNTVFLLIYHAMLWFVK